MHESGANRLKGDNPALVPDVAKLVAIPATIRSNIDYAIDRKLAEYPAQGVARPNPSAWRIRHNLIAKRF
jgi:hypothetical protein